MHYFVCWQMFEEVFAVGTILFADKYSDFAVKWAAFCDIVL